MRGQYTLRLTNGKIYSSSCIAGRVDTPPLVFTLLYYKHTKSQTNLLFAVYKGMQTLNMRNIESYCGIYPPLLNLPGGGWINPFSACHCSEGFVWDLNFDKLVQTSNFQTSQPITLIYIIICGCASVIDHCLIFKIPDNMELDVW